MSLSAAVLLVGYLSVVAQPLTGFALMIVSFIYMMIVATSIEDATADKAKVPDRVLEMLADEPSLSNAYKVGIAEYLQKHGSMDFEVLRELNTKFCRQHDREIAEKQPGFQKLVRLTPSDQPTLDYSH